MKFNRASKTTLLLLRDVFDLFLINPFSEGKFKNFLRKSMMKKADISFYGLANKGDVVIQGGCFMIETVSKWSEIVGPKGKVIIVEASKKNCDILKYEVSRRYLTNVIIINKGIWDKKSEMKLDFSDNSHKNKLEIDGIRTKILTDEDYEKKEVVEVDTIEEILKQAQVDRLDVVCLTVSGAEREALRGRHNILVKDAPRVWIRCSFYDKQTNNHTSEDCRDILKKYGYGVAFAKMNKGKVARNILGCKNK